MFRREYKQSAYDMAAEQMKFLKPKPKWIPMWVWLRGLKVFVKINFHDKHKN